MIAEWLPEHDLLAYMEVILRVYNAYGRRDNLYKARIKILVQALGQEAFAEKVEAEFAAIPRARYRLGPEIDIMLRLTDIGDGPIRDWCRTAIAPRQSPRSPVPLRFGD
jgi:sulfite reductase beta subunit-like hemoprotein